MSMVRIEHPEPLFPELPGVIQPAVFIAWKRECHRSTMTARAFQLQLWLIAPIRGKAKWRVLMRYALSSGITVLTLLTKRPRTLFVLNQPMPLVLIADLYARATGAKLVLDSHSKPFASGRGPSKWYCAIARRAWFNINHNRDDMATVEAIPARSLLIPEIVGQIDFVADPDANPCGPSVLVVCSFAEDEPVQLFIELARKLPNINFYFTGDWQRSPEMRAGIPSNVTALGFVPRATYLTYAARVSAVLTLSLRPQIMQMAAEEALCLGTPIVTNHSPVLEEVFSKGCLFSHLDADALAAAVQDAVARHDLLAADVRALAHERNTLLRRNIAQAIR
jgi:glycosyltransferase involved in cell wall biosynthesis